MTYRDFRLVGVREKSTVVCVLTQSSGRSEDVYLQELVPFFTDVLVGFAMNLGITVPGFAILLGLARVGLYRWTTTGRAR
jgi:hypothetical protein